MDSRRGSMKLLIGALFLLASVFSSCWSGSVLALESIESESREWTAGDRVIVVLKSGDEVIGELVEETDEKISVKSAFGVTSIEMENVQSVIRGEEVDRRELAQRKKRAVRRGSASGWYSLGKWATERGMLEEATAAYENALEIAPDHEPSKIALGWGKVDGQWKDPAEAQELISQGWTREGERLVPPVGGALKPKPTPKPKPPVTQPGDPGTSRSPRTPDSVAKRLTPEERIRREKELERRRKDREKFEEGKRKEYEGVSWSNRSVIKSRNWIIECNSTPEVARTYQWIMEALHNTLGKIFKSPDIRSQRPVVKIYRSHEEFMLKTGMGGGVGGFYNPGSQNVTAYHGTFGLTGTTFTVLAHEGTHAFQGKKLARMANYPNWFIEGMAVYFGDGSKLDYKKKKLVTGLIPRDRLFHIQDKIKDGTHTELSKLGGLPRNRFGGTHYADSWAVMHYLINGPQKKRGQKFLVEYWLMGEKRRVGQRQFNDLAKKYFSSIDEMETEWQQYVLDLKPDPAGEVDGDRFTSLDFVFSVERPNSRWEYVEDDIEDRDLVLMRIPDTRNEIRVRILSKSEENQQPQEWVDSELLPNLRKKYADVRTLKGDLGGLDAFLFEFVDRPPAVKKPPEEGADKEEKEKADSRKTLAAIQDGEDGEGETSADAPKEEPPALRKHRSYILVGVSNAYELRGSFELDEFANWLPDLEWVAFSFEKIQRNRW